MRFPLREVFLDDLESEIAPPAVLRKTMARLLELCATAGGSISKQLTEAQIAVAVWCTRLFAQQWRQRRLRTAADEREGCAVLIFVSGISEVEMLAEAFSSDEAAAYDFVPIHSDIPLDEQAAALERAGGGAIKVIAATNAAESSLTLPDVDLVICLGTRRQMGVCVRTEAQQLRRGWISRASAQQRAGRTARLRPGTVYRLYPRSLFERMEAYDPGELARQPLTSTLLQLRQMLHATLRVSSVLREAMEPPAVPRIKATLHELVQLGLLVAATDAQ
eukprot:2541037-Pleurochrysis_carterae.AAC.1